MRKHCNCAARPPQCLHSPPAAHAGHGDVGSARPSVSYETSALFSTLLPTFFQMWCNLLRGGQFLVDCIFMGMFAYWFKPAVLSMAIRYATSNGCEVKGGLKTTPCEMAATPLCTSECPELFLRGAVRRAQKLTSGNKRQQWNFMSAWHFVHFQFGRNSVDFEFLIFNKK